MTADRRSTTMYTEKLVMQHWPTATGLRREEDACPNCKRKGEFVSFVLAEYATVVEGAGVSQSCGFMCGLCGWSNAGARPVEEGESR